MKTNASKTSTSLNFVWLNKEPANEPVNGISVLPIPLLFLDNACRLANDNAHTDTQIWIDFVTTGERDLSALNAYIQKKSPIVILRDLTEIEGYRNEPIFNKAVRLPGDRCEPIYQKVDLARIMVLDHVLKTSQARDVFYCDIDIENPQLRSEKLAGALDLHGMIFGKSNRNNQNKVFHLENQFIGVRRCQASFVSDVLLPETLSDIVRNGNNGWGAFGKCVRAKFCDVDPSLEAVSIRTYEIGRRAVVPRENDVDWTSASVKRSSVGKESIRPTSKTAFPKLGRFHGILAL